MSDSKKINNNNNIIVEIGTGGAFVFNGFGKLNGKRLELSDKAIHALIPAMLTYVWQHDYSFPERLSKKQEKALERLAFRDINTWTESAEEDELSRQSAQKQAEQLIKRDPTAFDRIRHAALSFLSSDGRPDLDLAAPALFVMLNQFIDAHLSSFDGDLSDSDRHYLRITLAEHVYPGDEDVDEYLFADQEADDVEDN